MGDVKATTIAQRFGFKDPQLSTPSHDEIMLAIAADPTALICDIWPELLKRAHDTIVEWEWPIVSENTRTGQKFPVGFVDMRMEWSYNHTCKKIAKKDLRKYYYTYYDNKEAFLDECVGRDLNAGSSYARSTAETERLYEENITYRVKNYRWNKSKCSIDTCNSGRGGALVEVKPTTPSLGELMRQIQMYRTYVDATYVVATPDETYVEELTNMPGIEYCKTKKKGPKK